MKHGDLVTCAVRSDFGKPRPALVVQSDRFETASVALLLITSTLIEARLLRIPVHPTHANGLRSPSHIMIDGLFTLPQDRVGPVIGRLEDETMILVLEKLTTFLGLDS